MSDPERGAYAPPNEPPLAFDPRHGGRGGRPVPFTLIISALVLAGLVAAIFVFYRSGVRQAGQPPQAVGEPMGAIRADAPPEAQPTDPAAGLQIYKSELPTDAPPPEPRFAPPPEQPQPRAAPPPVVVTRAPVAPSASVAPAPAPATGLRPSLPATPPPAPTQAPTPAPTPAQKAAPAPTPAPKTATPAPPAAASGTAAVQIGAFSSQALADRGLAEARAAAPAATAGRGQSIQRIERDGGALYRTALTGFPSREAATAFCNQLKAAGKSCFVR